MEKRSPLVVPAFTIAALGVGVGAVTGILTIAAKNDLQARCVNGKSCGPAEFADLDRGRAMGNVSTIAVIIGAAGGAVGIYGLTHPTTSSKASSASSPTVRPFLGAGSLGFHGTF